MIESGKFDAYSYIKQHSHINYCEVVIYPNGTVDEATPSHQQRLIAITGLSEPLLWSAIPVWADVLKWLCCYTGCICVWYGFYRAYMPPTQEQKDTLRALVNNNIVSFQVVC